MRADERQLLGVGARREDLYVLASVLHDWNDERSQQFLRTCAEAMRPGARLLVIERIQPELVDTSPGSQDLPQADLVLHVVLAAQERTELESGKLLASSGFDVRTEVPAAGGFSIIEASKR